MPCINSMMIGKPASRIFGKLSSIAWAKLSMMDAPISNNCGAISARFDTISSIPLPIAARPPSESPVTIAVRPSMTDVMPGKN